MRSIPKCEAFFILDFEVGTCGRKSLSWSGCTSGLDLCGGIHRKLSKWFPPSWWSHASASHKISLPSRRKRRAWRIPHAKHLARSSTYCCVFVDRDTFPRRGWCSARSSTLTAQSSSTRVRWKILSSCCVCSSLRSRWMTNLKLTVERLSTSSALEDLRRCWAQEFHYFHNFSHQKGGWGAWSRYVSFPYLSQGRRCYRTLGQVLYLPTPSESLRKSQPDTGKVWFYKSGCNSLMVEYQMASFQSQNFERTVG